jgi:Grx4 family monothiol glutaredoxin
MTVLPILSLAEFEAAQSASELQKCMFFFWAKWHEPSKVGGQLQEIYAALAEKYSKLNFYIVEAEAQPAVSERMKIAVVPTFCATMGKFDVGKVEGVNPAELSKLAKQLMDATEASGAELLEKEKKTKEAALLTKLENLVKASPVMLFMKGSTSEPKCGFSRQMVEILKANEVPFATFDILTDLDVREGLKKLSDWPTYPQLYVNGELVGGLDIVKEMVESAPTAGSLKEQMGIQHLQLPPPPLPLEERLRALVNQAPVMVFIKGTPDAPKCGFSRSIVGILNESAIAYEHFDILTDDEVRAGLKTFSDWPTYPQLYVNGALAGGLDIVKEMVEAGNLKEQLGL